MKMKADLPHLNQLYENPFKMVRPFADIRRVMIDKDTGEILYRFEDDNTDLYAAGYDETKHDIMVYIPCYYLKRQYMNGKKYESLLNLPVNSVEWNGYKVDSTFLREDGSVRPYILVGAFKGSIGEPKVNLARKENFTYSLYDTSYEIESKGQFLTVKISPSVFENRFDGVIRKYTHEIITYPEDSEGWMKIELNEPDGSAGVGACMFAPKIQDMRPDTVHKNEYFECEVKVSEKLAEKITGLYSYATNTSTTGQDTPGRPVFRMVECNTIYKVVSDITWKPSSSQNCRDFGVVMEGISHMVLNPDEDYFFIRNVVIKSGKRLDYLTIPSSYFGSMPANINTSISLIENQSVKPVDLIYMAWVCPDQSLESRTTTLIKGEMNDIVNIVSLTHENYGVCLKSTLNENESFTVDMRVWNESDKNDQLRSIPYKLPVTNITQDQLRGSARTNRNSNFNIETIGSISTVQTLYKLAFQDLNAQRVLGLGQVYKPTHESHNIIFNTFFKQTYENGNHIIECVRDVEPMNGWSYATMFGHPKCHSAKYRYTVVENNSNWELSVGGFGKQHTRGKNIPGETYEFTHEHPGKWDWYLAVCDIRVDRWRKGERIVLKDVTISPLEYISAGVIELSRLQETDVKWLVDTQQDKEKISIKISDEFLKTDNFFNLNGVYRGYATLVEGDVDSFTVKHRGVDSNKMLLAFRFPIDGVRYNWTSGDYLVSVVSPDVPIKSFYIYGISNTRVYAIKSGDTYHAIIHVTKNDVVGTLHYWCERDLEPDEILHFQQAEIRKLSTSSHYVQLLPPGSLEPDTWYTIQYSIAKNSEFFQEVCFHQGSFIKRHEIFTGLNVISVMKTKPAIDSSYGILAYISNRTPRSLVVEGEFIIVKGKIKGELPFNSCLDTYPNMKLIKLRNGEYSETKPICGETGSTIPLGNKSGYIEDSSKRLFNGTSPVSLFGIEDIYGNVNSFIDGVYSTDNGYYLSNNPKSFGDINKHKLIDVKPITREPDNLLLDINNFNTVGASLSTNDDTLTITKTEETDSESKIELKPSILNSSDVYNLNCRVTNSDVPLSMETVKLDINEDTFINDSSEFITNSNVITKELITNNSHKNRSLSIILSEDVPVGSTVTIKGSLRHSEDSFQKGFIKNTEANLNIPYFANIPNQLDPNEIEATDSTYFTDYVVSHVKGETNTMIYGGCGNDHKCAGLFNYAMNTNHLTKSDYIGGRLVIYPDDKVNDTRTVDTNGLVCDLDAKELINVEDPTKWNNRSVNGNDFDLNGFGYTLESGVDGNYPCLNFDGVGSSISGEVENVQTIQMLVKKNEKEREETLYDNRTVEGQKIVNLAGSEPLRKTGMLFPDGGIIEDGLKCYLDAETLMNTTDKIWRDKTDNHNDFILNNFKDTEVSGISADSSIHFDGVSDFAKLGYRNLANDLIVGPEKQSKLLTSSGSLLLLDSITSNSIEWTGNDAKLDFEFNCPTGTRQLLFILDSISIYLLKLKSFVVSFEFYGDFTVDDFYCRQTNLFERVVNGSRVSFIYRRENNEDLERLRIYPISSGNGNSCENRSFNLHGGIKNLIITEGDQIVPYVDDVSINPNQTFKTVQMLFHTLDSVGYLFDNRKFSLHNYDSSHSFMNIHENMGNTNSSAVYMNGYRLTNIDNVKDAIVHNQLNVITVVGEFTPNNFKVGERFLYCDDGDWRSLRLNLCTVLLYDRELSVSEINHNNSIMKNESFENHKNAIKVNGWSYTMRDTLKYVLSDTAAISKFRIGVNAHWEMLDSVPTLIFNNDTTINKVPNRWQGASRDIRYNLTHKMIKPGLVVTISWDQFSKGSGGSALGINAHWSNGHTGFNELRRNVFNSKNETWERMSETFTIKDSVEDNYIGLYFYGPGYNTVENAITLIRNIQLEINDIPTEFIQPGLCREDGTNRFLDTSITNTNTTYDDSTLLEHSSIKDIGNDFNVVTVLNEKPISGNMLIGTDYKHEKYFNGSLIRVLMYDRVLDYDEVTRNVSVLKRNADHLFWDELFAMGKLVRIRHKAGNLKLSVGNVTKGVKWTFCDGSVSYENSIDVVVPAGVSYLYSEDLAHMSVFTNLTWSDENPVDSEDYPGNMLNGDLSDFSNVGFNLRTYHSNIGGDLKYINSKLNRISTSSCAGVYGDICNLKNIKYSCWVTNAVGVYGDISAISSVAYDLGFKNTNVSGILNPTGTVREIQLQNTKMTSNDTDQTIINLNNVTTVKGTLKINKNRTSASDEAFNSLKAKGWTITEYDV